MIGKLSLRNCNLGNHIGRFDCTCQFVLVSFSSFKVCSISYFSVHQMVVNTVQDVGLDTDLVILRYADFSLSSFYTWGCFPLFVSN